MLQKRAKAYIGSIVPFIFAHQSVAAQKQEDGHTIVSEV